MVNRSIWINHSQFSDSELAALRALRSRYQSTSYRFTDREQTHLRFVHWLIRRPDWNRALDEPARAGVLM